MALKEDKQIIGEGGKNKNSAGLMPSPYSTLLKWWCWTDNKDKITSYKGRYRITDEVRKIFYVELVK